MTTINNYEKLLNFLQSSTDISNDELVIVSPELLENKRLLDDIGIRYDSVSEVIKIDLSNQEFKLFKTKKDAVNRLSAKDLSVTILIIEDSLIFLPNFEYSNSYIFFNNVLYWHKMKELLITEDICTHDDILKQSMVFLSEKLGKVHVGYKSRWKDDFYSKNNELKMFYQTIKNKIANNSEFKSFLRDNFLNTAQKISDPKLRYTETLESISHVVELAEKDFELFKNNFSFEEFKNNLEKEQEKYFKDYQSAISDFLSKVASMPLQFGAYIFLIFRFYNEFMPLICTLFLIIAWSFFTILSVNQIRCNTIFLKKKFNSNFDSLIEKSKISPDDIKESRNDINEKFCKTIFLLTNYKYVEIIFTLFSLLICIYFVTKMV